MTVIFSERETSVHINGQETIITPYIGIEKVNQELLAGFGFLTRYGRGDFRGFRYTPLSLLQLWRATKMLASAQNVNESTPFLCYIAVYPSYRYTILDSLEPHYGDMRMFYTFKDIIMKSVPPPQEFEQMMAGAFANRIDINRQEIIDLVREHSMLATKRFHQICGKYGELPFWHEMTKSPAPRRQYEWNIVIAPRQ